MISKDNLIKMGQIKRNKIGDVDDFQSSRDSAFCINNDRVDATYN